VPFFFGGLLSFTVGFVSAYHHAQACIRTRAGRRGSRRTASAYVRFLKYRPSLAAPEDDKLVVVMPKDPKGTLATPKTVVMVVPILFMPVMVSTIFIVIPIMDVRNSDDRPHVPRKRFRRPLE